jgi:deoxyribodipyrimidine photo-lyase
MMAQKQKINLVWLKRDLRLKDHEPLYLAAKSNLPSLIFYSFEPRIINYPDWDLRHSIFIEQSLFDMQRKLNKASKQIYLFHEDIKDLILKLDMDYDIEHVFSHMEVGNNESFKRDLELKDFFAAKNIKWRECCLNGIIRGLKDRRNWSKKFSSQMSLKDFDFELEELTTLSFSPSKLNIKSEEIDQILNSNYLNGGEDNASLVLNSFFESRSLSYNKFISKPLGAQYYCSRLAPYLSWGNLSLKQVMKQNKRRLYSSSDKWQRRNLEAFDSRLFWRSHFVQKFESEISMEFVNQNKAFDQIRYDEDKEIIEAWQKGQTGYPLIDASMRCLQETGYINFRMRACVTSFLTHILWQPWQSGAYHLARVYQDYEPGIHFPQLQMQAGTTGINTLRIYNPYLQSERQDQDASFIRRWVPELRDTPTELIHKPRSINESSLFIAEYTKPIIDYKPAYRKAKEILWQVKKSPEARANRKKILDRHVQSGFNFSNMVGNG